MGRARGLGRGAPLSELFDKLTQKGGELVPFEREPGTDDAGFGPGSPFDRFLGRLVPGQPPDDDYKRALLYGAVGSMLSLVGAGLLAALPSGQSIQDSAIILLGDITLGRIVDGAGSLALPLAILAGVLLLATGLLWVTERRDGLTGTVCVVQPAVGVVAVGGSVVPWILLALAVALTIVIYVLAVIFAFALLIGVLAGMAE